MYQDPAATIMRNGKPVGALESSLRTIEKTGMLIIWAAIHYKRSWVMR